MRTHLQTLNTVTGLDPTLRQLTSAEKYSRSIRILRMTRAALDLCAASIPDETRQLMKTADATIAGKQPAHATNEAAEGVLTQARKLWQGGASACEDRSQEARPRDLDVLDLIMSKLAS